MLKKILCANFIFFGFFLHSQNFNLVYNFNQVTNSTGTIDPTPVPNYSNLTCASFTAFGVSTNPNASLRFTYTNWGTGASTLTTNLDDYSSYTGALDTTKFYEVALTPSPGYSLNLNAVSFSMRRSATGVRNYSVRSSLNNYANNLPASVGTNTKLSVLSPDVFFWNFDATSNSADQKGSIINLPSTYLNFGSSIHFRFYAWNAEGTGGTFSIDSVVFIGTVSNSISVPTGVSKITQNLNAIIKIGPNPSNSGFINLYSPIAFKEVEVTDMNGKTIFSDKNIKNENAIKLSTENFSEGIYFIQIKTTDLQLLTEKFIVSGN